MALIINVDDENLLGFNTSSLFGAIMLVLFVERQHCDFGEIILQSILNLHDTKIPLTHTESIKYRSRYTDDSFDYWYNEIGSLFYGQISQDSSLVLNSPFLQYPHFPTDQLIRYYYDAIWSFQQEVKAYIDLIDWNYKPTLIINEKTYETIIYFQT